jgi:plastocyanin
VKPNLGIVRAAPAFAMAFAVAACSADHNSTPLPDSGKSGIGPDVQDAGPARDSDGATPSGDDGGSFLCATTSFADCKTFTDWTDAGTDRTILFKNYQYDPRCVQVRPGQSVAFKGDFVVHPLAQACGPADIIEHRLPINVNPGSETSTAFTLPEAGLYGYYCLDHGNAQGVAMAGAILVSPE